MSTDTVDIDGRQVGLSKPAKQMYPGIDKADVIEYYRHVAPLMLPGLRDRPLTLRRYPDGITGKGFVQQEASEHFPDWIRTKTLPARTDRPPVRHVLCDDTATLVYLANQACLELHTWLARAEQPEHPDLLVLDLDPPDDTPIDRLRRATRRARDVLAQTGLTPFLRTTGGTGFHLVVALDGAADHDTVRAFANEVADRLVADEELFTTQQRRNRRGSAIFVDTGRNAYGQTAVASYSLRARPAAPVAVPLDWDELGRVTPGKYNLATLSRRLARKSDPWAELFTEVGSVPAARRRLDRRTLATSARAEQS